MAKRASAPAGGNPRVAVIDIGSNSIRLVVFDRLSRVPVALFNEKVLCGLGRGLATNGRLNEAGVELALPNLTRLRTLAQPMHVGRPAMPAPPPLHPPRHRPPTPPPP